MKKVLATLGAAAALSAPAAGIAAAQGSADSLGAPAPTTTAAPADKTEGTTTDGTKTDGTDPKGETDPKDPKDPAKTPSKEAESICGALRTANVTGSLAGIAPGLDGDACATAVDSALTKLRAGDPAGALDVVRTPATTTTTTTPDEKTGDKAGDTTGDKAAEAAAEGK